jgi:acyl-CoA-binding protein
MPSAAFDAAAAKAKTLASASNDDLLALYKYFKQATVGDGAFVPYVLPPQR